MAAVEWGEFSVTGVEGSPEEPPLPMSSLLERALLCERLGWQVLPSQLDGEGLELSQALSELAAFRAGQQYAKDLGKMTPEQVELLGWVEQMRARRKSP